MHQLNTKVFPREAVRPRRLAVSGAVSVGLTAGLLPYLVFIRRPSWAIVYVLLVLALALAKLRSFDTPATRHSSLGEVLVGGWNAALQGSTLSLMGLFFYFCGYWIWRAVSVVVSLFDGQMISSAQAWGFWTSLVWVVFLAVFIVGTVAEAIANKLYPPTAGMRSPYLSLLQERRTLALLLLATLAGVTIAIVYLEPGRWPYSLILALGLFYPAMAIENHERQTATPQKARVVGAIEKLLNHAGYTTLVSPRTGRSDLDPFLKSVDLLAESAHRNLVLEVKSRHRTTTPVPWESASLLRTAASAMQEALAEQDESRTVEPLLVVVGRAIAPSLESFSEKEGFPFRLIEDEAIIEQIAKEMDSEALRAMAARHLGLESVGPPALEPGAEVADG